MTGTGRPDRLAIGVVALLFLVPAAILAAGPKPTRFGFQMYSGYGMVSATWTDGTGNRRMVDLGRHVASDRAEIDWTTFLPDELCRRIPGAVRVEVSRTQPGGVERRSARC